MDFNFYNTNLLGGFLKGKQDLNLKTTIRAVYDRFLETGRFESCECNWTPEQIEEKKPHLFWDSDVAKWIEAASYAIAKNPNEFFENEIEKMIDRFEENQWEDGYLNTYYTMVEPGNRFKYRSAHELYCAGHLMEAAVAYYYATGKDRFLKMMERYADFINKVFIEENSAGFVTPGHEEIELALLRMYRCTKNEKYLNMCKFFLTQRGLHDKDDEKTIPYKQYNQTDVPVYKIEEAVGHSVRATYLYTAMADYANLTNDEELKAVCRKVFDNIVNKKMYINGAIGQTRWGEAFAQEYFLPNETAYAETCAAIGLAFFAQRMLEDKACGIYADVIERVLYNSIISGLSMDGVGFFYENPLEITLSKRKENECYGKEVVRDLSITQRVEVFWCSCCPPNVGRVLSSMERYLYHKKDGVYFVDQYCESEFCEDGVKIIQKTNYPINGDVEICFEGVKRAAVRIPSWCHNFSISAEYELVDSYAYIKNPTNVKIKFEIKPMLYKANAKVEDCANKVAVTMGPVVYCAESVDNGVSHHRLSIDKNLNAVVKYNEQFMLNEIEADGYEVTSSDALYEPFADEYKKRKIKLIPYYAFANRGESDMGVWLNFR